MNKIIIRFQYGCYPVWVYNGRKLIINDLPWELSEEREIDDAFAEAQSIYDSLFAETPEGLQYAGFKSEADKLQFIDLTDSAINLMKMKMGSFYRIEKKIDV
jgi:hypothetical protein